MRKRSGKGMLRFACECKANLRGSEVAGIKPFAAVLCVVGRRERERENRVFFCLSLRAAVREKKCCDVCTEPQVAAMFEGCAHLCEGRSLSQKAQDMTDAGYNHR